MIDASAKPRLAPKARLRADAKTGKTLLVYPEAGLQLNGTGAEILRRCDGQRTVASIVSELAAHYAAEPSLIEREVTALLSRLVDKGLLVVEP